jgi:hypothetical protein
MTTDKRDKIVAWVVIGIAVIISWFVCQWYIFPWYFDSGYFGPNPFK